MKSEFIIGFSGLKEGIHEFHFKIGNEFFEQLDYSEIREGNLNVFLKLEKKTTMMVANFSIEGDVVMMCDRCSDDFRLPVNGRDELIYKFSDLDEDDERIVCIGSAEVEIDVTQPIYEFTTLLLPHKRLHPEGECNEEMLSAMDEYLMIESNETPEENPNVEEENIDPRWAALKKLKDNK